MREIWILFLFLVLSLPLMAADKNVSISWSEVQGARGYLLEIQFPDKRIQAKKKVRTNQANLKLPEGTYTVRVAALNKFGKPGEFSDWEELEVSLTDDRQTIQLGEKKDLKKETSESQAGEWAYWKNFVPGWKQYEYGNKKFAYGMWAGLAVATAYGLSEMQRGNLYASSKQNSPNRLFWEIQATPLWYGLYLRQRFISNQNKFNQAQMAQEDAAFFAVGIFLCHLLDVFWLHSFDVPADSPKTSWNFMIYPSVRYGQVTSNVRISYELRF